MIYTIITEDDYRKALKRFFEISDSAENTPEAEELEILIKLMQIYEQDNCS